MPDQILTLSEVAELLKVAEKIVYTMIGEGNLPVFKVREQWHFRGTNLDCGIDAKTRCVAGGEMSE